MSYLNLAHKEIRSLIVYVNQSDLVLHCYRNHEAHQRERGELILTESLRKQEAEICQE